MRKAVLFFFLGIISLAGYAQEEDQYKNRKTTDLANFLDLKMIPGFNFESDLFFQFWRNEFPELDVSSPATAEKYFGGDYSVNVRWFDTNLQEVKKPHSPGRYAYYAEITGANGVLMRRSATIFCTPSEWQGWSEDINADIEYFPYGNIPQHVWEENREPISHYAGQIMLKSILDNQQGGILLAYIYEMNKRGLKPAPYLTPIIMDGDYHTKLKQQILGVENKYKRLAPPQKSDVKAPMLQALSEKEKRKNKAFEDELSALCTEWAESSGEPFDMLIAKDGKILFHEAFGENLNGKFTMEEPTEIASITKLYTGLLFAQYVDQGIIEIDDYVGDFLPDFPIKGNKAVTLRQCFTHTTGFWGHGSFGGVQNSWLDNSLALWLPYLSVGTDHNYNGMGYNLAGKVMEITEGKSIFHLMQDQLFDPLKLQNTQLDMDLAYGTKTTAYDMAVIGQMLLNKGRYGNLQFFSEETYNALLPKKLETYFPNIKDTEWGIGITSMNWYKEDENTGSKRAILSNELIGHGSATSSVLRVDPKNKIVITQSRMNGGELFDTYFTKVMLLIEQQL